MTNVMKDVKLNEKLMFYSTGNANGGGGLIYHKGHQVEHKVLLYSNATVKLAKDN